VRWMGLLNKRGLRVVVNVCLVFELVVYNFIWDMRYVNIVYFI
jgi:hypothetical protein